MSKSYNYDEVIEFCKAGGPIDNSLAQLQEDLKNLRLITEQCQELFHGEGASGIYSAYDTIFKNIGYANSGSSVGAWGVAANIRTINSSVYYNALRDKEADEQGEIQ
ncbi:MAG: hypothetical protein OSJ70_02920 [Bacilli bacterium]|nr:hypothetical protein [Bacilli bacterium]